MITVLIVNILAVFFAFIESNKSNKHGLKISIFIIFLFLALRYDFGNDYMGYLEMFREIYIHASWGIASFNIKGNEIGWFYLNRIFGLLGYNGFFAMVAVLAAFNCNILYRFIRKYVPSRYYWFAIFLYTFQVSQMLTLSSAMRQAVAVSVFMLAIDFIIKKEPIKYLILIFIATLFHTSAVVLFPFIIFAYINRRIKLIHIAIIFVIFTILAYSVNETFQYINIITSDQYINDYTYYLKDVESVSSPKLGAGFMLNIIIYFIVMYYSRFETKNTNNLLFKIAIMSFLIIPLGFSIQLIGRLNFYLMPVFLAVFPLVFDKMNGLKRYSYIGIVILFTLYDFYIFFNMDLWKSFRVYHTIFTF